MTITLPAPVTHPRALLPAGLYDRLVRRIATDHPEHTDRAGQIMDQALAYLAACAACPGKPLSPSKAVDIGWHTFILYTREYAEFCDRLAGRFIHHCPDDDPATVRLSGPSTVQRAMAVMEDLGLPVVKDLWQGAADCNDSGGGDKCHQCHAGCVDSPQS